MCAVTGPTLSIVARGEQGDSNCSFPCSVTMVRGCSDDAGDECACPLVQVSRVTLVPQQCDSVDSVQVCLLDKCKDNHRPPCPERPGTSSSMTIL